MADDPDEVVTMYHEANPDDPQQVTRAQYESVWKAVGWRLTPPAKKSDKKKEE